jgi:hypothetical protein
MFHRTLACLALMPVWVAGTPGTAWAEVLPLRVGGDPRVHPVDFRSTVLATGAVVYLDLATGGYFQFVGNDEPAVGLDGLVPSGDQIFRDGFEAR